MKMQKIISLFVFAIITNACSNTKQAQSMLQNNFDKQGHRGCRGLMPENTIPAMLKAIDLGVSTLEMDVVISQDKKVVVSHDPNFNEYITTTPEGNFLTKAEAAARLLYKMDYDSIKKYDVGLKPHPLYPRQQKIAVYKPLLTNLIEAAEAHAKQKGVAIAYNIEIKSNPANDGKKHPLIEEFVDLVMAVIKSAGISERITIQSFDPRALQVMHKKFASTNTALLIEDDDNRTMQEQLVQLGFTPVIYSPHFSLVTPLLITECRRKKMKVIPWTVNTIEEMRKQKTLGVGASSQIRSASV